MSCRKRRKCSDDRCMRTHIKVFYCSATNTCFENNDKNASKYTVSLQSHEIGRQYYYKRTSERTNTHTCKRNALMARHQLRQNDIFVVPFSPSVNYFALCVCFLTLFFDFRFTFVRNIHVAWRALCWTIALPNRKFSSRISSFCVRCFG